MRSVVRIVKREERKAGNDAQIVDSASTAQRSTPEMIVRGWITASRERRRAEAEEYRRGFHRWQESLSLSVS